MGPVFCLCVGGCGSKYLVHLLTQNGLPGCVHEQAPTLDRLGVDYFQGRVARAQAAERIAQTRQDLKFEASNRLFSLADPIQDAFPDSRFIFLFRDGRESVRSIWSNPKIAEIMEQKYRFRQISRPPEHRELSTLEKVCLYWANINERILNDLQGKPHMLLSFEDLIAGKLGALETFLDHPLPLRDLAAQNEKPDIHGNRRPPFDAWAPEEQLAFDRICGRAMTMLGYY